MRRLAVPGHGEDATRALHLHGVARVAHGLPADALKAGLYISGMYDLEAPLRSARSAYVEVITEEADALSAQRNLRRIRRPIVVAHGERESPEFRRHAVQFAAPLRGEGVASELLVGTGLNHFEILETLGRPDGLLGRAAPRQIGL